MAILYPGNLDSFTDPTATSTLDSPSHSGQHIDLNAAVEIIEAKLGIGTATASTATSYQVLTKGTGTTTSWATINVLSTPNITGGTANALVLTSPEETINIVATASSGTVNADLATSGVTYATANATANWVMNLRGDGTATVNSLISVGQSISHVYMNTNAGTAYYPTAFRVDGTAVTPRWQSAGTPTSGNTNSIDAFAFTVIKTATTPTYTVLASQTRFA